jgi:hypothetical protein
MVWKQHVDLDASGRIQPAAILGHSRVPVGVEAKLTLGSLNPTSSYQSPKRYAA